MFSPFGIYKDWSGEIHYINIPKVYFYVFIVILLIYKIK